MDHTTSNRNISPCADDAFNSIGMIEEFRYATVDSDDLLFWPSSQSDTDVGAAVNKSHLKTYNNPTQLNDGFLPQCSKDTINSDQLESIMNETICQPKELAPLVNYQELYSNDAAYVSSPIIPAFPSSPSTNFRSNGFTYQMSNSLENNQVLQQPLQTMARGDITNDTITPENEGSTTLKNSSGCIIEDKTDLNIFQKSDFDHQSLLNAANKKRDANTDSSTCIMGPQIHGDPLVLVPLSIVRSLMKTNNFHALPHEINRESEEQLNSCPQESIQGNLSNSVIESPEEVQDQLDQTTEVDGSITPLDSNLTQNQQKYDSTKNDQRQFSTSKVTKRRKIVRIKSKLDERKKLKSLKSIRTVAGVKAPFVRLQKGKLKSPATPTKSALLCKVCGDEEDVHVHYGGKSCKSCRQFFRRTVEKSTRQAGFGYPCKCSEGCLQKGAAICFVSKITRSHCRYCRFKRCQTLAGMSKQWVISAHIPKVERNPIKKTQSKSKDAKKGSEKERNDKLIEMKTSTRKKIIRQIGYHDAMDNNLPFSVDPQLIKELKKLIDTEGTDFSRKTQDDLELFLNQQITLVATNIPEFAQLESKIRVSLMQKNSAQLRRLGLIRFVYDHILLEESNGCVISALYNILSSDYWKEKAYSSLCGIQLKRHIRKRVELINGDRKMFTYLFPILLFNSDGMDIDEKIKTHQLHYMELLEGYLVTQLKNDRKLVAKRLGITSEMIYYNSYN